MALLFRRIAAPRQKRIIDLPSLFFPGSSPESGVPDMTIISDIDETGINRNLQVRYDRDQIYVSFFTNFLKIKF